MRYVFMTAACGLLGTPALAAVDLSAAQACFIAKTEPTTCIDAAQADCMASLSEAPSAATVCFRAAQEVWSEGIGAQINVIASQPDETLTAVARIETKYDLLTNMLQCDKIEDLSKAASDLTGEMIAAQKAACQSTASGLSYMRLMLRSRSLPVEPAK